MKNKLAVVNFLMQDIVHSVIPLSLPFIFNYCDYQTINTLLEHAWGSVISSLMDLYLALSTVPIFWLSACHPTDVQHQQLLFSFFILYLIYTWTTVKSISLHVIYVSIIVIGINAKSHNFSKRMRIFWRFGSRSVVWRHHNQNFLFIYMLQTWVQLSQKVYITYT